MKYTILATLMALGFMMSSISSADEAKNSNQEISKPQNLTSQILDNSKDANSGKIEAADSESKKKADEDEATPKHFAGHAFSQ